MTKPKSPALPQSVEEILSLTVRDFIARMDQSGACLELLAVEVPPIGMITAAVAVGPSGDRLLSTLREWCTEPGKSGNFRTGTVPARRP